MTSYDHRVATRQTAGTRAKDSNRNDTCAVLDSALADGQLSMEEHRQRVAAATSAATLGDLQALVSDLQNDKAPVQMPELQEPSKMRAAAVSVAGVSRGLLAAVAVVLVVLGIGIGWGLYGNSSSPLSFETDPGAKSDGIPAKVLTPPRQLMSLGGLTGLFEQMKQKFGDTTGYSMTIFTDYASLTRQDPTEPRRALSYSYRGGFDDPSETSVSSDERVVDLAAFDIPMFVGIIRGAPETLGIDPAEVDNIHLSIDPSDDVTAPPDSIVLMVYVNPKFGNAGYIALNGDGSVKRISYPSE
ncbi:DUF1707 domain-containing protein [soil metagenome]